jgi:hypothetical protein
VKHDLDISDVDRTWPRCRALSSPLTTHCFVFVSQGDWVQAVWLSPFPYQMFGTIVGFIVVFRCESPAPALLLASAEPGM